MTARAGAAKRGEPRRRFQDGMGYIRFVRDIAYQHQSSGYHNEAELHEVFDQIGAKIVKLSKGKFIVIDQNQVLIYKRSKP